MNNPPPRPSLKSLPAIHRPPAAERPTPERAVGVPKGVAEGVPSAVRPDPQPGDGRWPVAWLHITAPGRGAIPTAASKCACGRDRSAVGHRKVHDLITDHTAHRDLCPLRTASPEGRTAA
ncbi:hypothetical protein QCN29_05680 [Streptomyces sp. HNM0663]|uniref:Uncharacterized protein n=1 Tax=Streptomyces chengmaiensis TaxID=3040919 RepID=A0ABT6HHQ2_9ACTN|nr:hypothetical protein [Streptomyces chengmaiensis]MDH2388287.1 hypothetical protein [Streptomyces chengmaiensis]